MSVVVYVYIPVIMVNNGRNRWHSSVFLSCLYFIFLDTLCILICPYMMVLLFCPALWTQVPIELSQPNIKSNYITCYFTVGTQPSSVKGSLKHLQSLHTNISRVLSLTLAEIDNETLRFKQPAYGLEVLTDHHQRSGLLVCPFTLTQTEVTLFHLHRGETSNFKYTRVSCFWVEKVKQRKVRR